MIFKTSAIIILSFVAASASVLDSASALVAGDGDEGVGSSNKGATRGGGMDIDLVDGGRFVPVDLSSSVAVGDGKVLKPSTVSSIDDIEDPLSIFPDKAMFVEANVDRLLKNNKTGKGAKNIKGGKKGKSKKEVDFQDSSDEEVNEQQCPIALFNGSYRYTSPCGKGLLVTIACGEDDDGGLGGDTCRYSERVVAQNACPESGLLNDEEEEDPCSVGGLFRQSENINYNADTDSCELAYFDLSEDRCELYLEEGGLGMKAVIHLSARQEMLLRFSFDSGETFYNEEAPRIAVVSSDVALYDTGRALSSDLIHAAKQRRLLCQPCGDCINISADLTCESWKNSNYCEKSSDYQLFMLQNCRLACTPECNKKKYVGVLIVGAGISGLSCGYHLNALVKDNPDANIQLQLEIVDARDDVGGRTQSVTDAAFITEAVLDLDMGGQDLFFGDQDQYAALLTDDDQEKFRNFRESFPTVSYSPVSGCESAINNVRDDCKASMFNFDEPSECTENKNDNYCVCVGNPPDSDVDIDGIVCNRTPSSLTAIANTREENCNEWCAKYVTGDTVTTCSENGDFYCNQNEEFPRDNRNASFADASLGTFVKEFFYEPLKEAKVKFNLNTQIEKIIYGPGKTKVKADWTKANGKTGTFNADHLVVAVPKTQIQDSTKLKFKPDLDPKFRAKFEGSRVIPGVRIWVEFETKFYDTVTDFPDSGARYWDAVKGYDTDRNIVTIQGYRNTALTSMTDIELRNLLIEDMDAAYNNAASKNFDYIANKFYVRNYAKEEFIEMSTGDEDIDFSDTEFSVEGTSLGLVDGRIWFIGDYYANFDDNTSAESGKLAAQKIWEKITS